MAGLFEFIDSITVTKKDLMVDNEAEKAYPPYVINQALSMNYDCIVAANEMNKRPGISKRMHYDFLRSILRKGKRYAKWAKNEKHEYLQDVITYFNVGKREAIQYIDALTKEQLDQVRHKIRKGGVDNG